MSEKVDVQNLSGKGRIHLYPVPGVSIPGVLSEELDVTSEEEAALMEYQPAAFSRKPSKEPEPEEPAINPEPSEQGGSSDSEES